MAPRPLPLLLLLTACGGEVPRQTVKDVPLDTPLRGATPEEVARFREGDALFDGTFRAPDGLGPLYVRASCGACHQVGARGPGGVQHVAMAQGELPFGHAVRPFTAGGAVTPVLAPDGGTAQVSLRLGPPLFGRGYLEAVEETEFLRLEAAQASGTDGVSGRVSRVTWQSEPHERAGYPTWARGTSGLVGRFGVKARSATLDDFSADALQGDMGLTSPLRPVELPNPDGLNDDAKPGVDVTSGQVDLLADYARLVEIPPRRNVQGGAKLFETTGCAACHVPSLRTRPDFPIRALAGIEAPLYTDGLLHDLGDGLADGITDESASGREWRTAPLCGLRFLSSYLHDGRADTLEEAVEFHASPGSEANVSVDRFRVLSPSDRALLLSFLEGL
ncbi:MAG: hypothetical protein RL653_272 [Pseudomonadota bacterium]|jgi:CxxC motif-containing protein (DUF1111 family)